jgi:hypothetical protein
MARSEGAKWKRLGRSRNVAWFTNSSMGRRPFSPTSGRNWFAATRKARRYISARPRWKRNRTSQ